MYCEAMGPCLHPFLQRKRELLFCCYYSRFFTEIRGGHNGWQDMLVWSDLTKVGLPSQPSQARLLLCLV